MKKVSQERLAALVLEKRKTMKMSQQALSNATGINRTLLSRIESKKFLPSIPQLEKLGEILGFDPTDVFVEPEKERVPQMAPMNIAVAGTGYVGLSLATLLAQHNHVTAVDIVPAKVDLINQKKSPIRDEYIEKYLKELPLDLTATTDGDEAYQTADFVIVATPTNYDSKKNFFDTSAVESVIEQVMRVTADKPEEEQPYIVIKSTIPVGYTRSVREKYKNRKIIFSPEFLRESKALYDNLYPSRIIVGCDKDDPDCVRAAQNFAN